MKILNLYAGAGGNAMLWDSVHQVTAVEYNKDIAKIYTDHLPSHEMVIGDAHQYLLENFREFDFIWSSPPCQTHSRMVKATRHPVKKYPDMALYQEIILLQHHFKGKWVVENVAPYYDMLIPGEKRGRHIFWSNFEIPDVKEDMPKGFINLSNVAGKKKLQDWLGIHYEKNIYYEGNHCPAQVLRNCVHPNVGDAILKAACKLNKNKLY